MKPVYAKEIQAKEAQDKEAQDKEAQDKGEPIKRKPRKQSTHREASTPAPHGHLNSPREQSTPARALRVLLALSTFLSAHSLSATAIANDANKDPADWEETEKGMPVRHDLTLQKCAGCHRPDEDGNLSRISWIRATPEGWSQTIKRMVTLHGASLTPDDARSIVQYLSTWHGLAPEEAEPVMYLPERRIITETNIPNETMRGACAACHAYAQGLSSRRSKREWALLQNMHVALYSQAAVQYNRTAPGQSDLDDDEKRTQGEIALEYLANNANLHSPEWASWRPRISAPKMAGKWRVSATLPGQGKFVGVMTIEPGDNPNDFTTTTSLNAVNGDLSMARNGEGVVYAGYSWRGRSTDETATPDALNAPQNGARETLFFSPDQETATGRWYWGAYHEFGFDVELSRISEGPAILGVYPGAAKTGETALELTIHGDDLPTDLTSDEFDFGAGISVREIISTTPDSVRVLVDISSSAPQGLHDVTIRNTSLEQVLSVYKRVDYLKVTPETALSRLGGEVYDKGYVQFDVVGYSSGEDEEPDTGDDFALGPIDVEWSIKEFPTVTYDDDVDYVGSLSADGLFTPAIEGPNPERRFSRNNYGEVWVVATAKSEQDETGKPLSASSYLVVTVPLYRQWDQPELTP